MKNTVKSHIDIDRLFSQGNKSSYPCVTVLALPSPTYNDFPYGRLGFIAGKKLGSAPIRSRSKRVLREAARELGGPWKGFDVVFIARPATATASYDRVVHDCKRALCKLEIEKRKGDIYAK